MAEKKERDRRAESTEPRIEETTAYCMSLGARVARQLCTASGELQIQATQVLADNGAKFNEDTLKAAAVDLMLQLDAARAWLALWNQVIETQVPQHMAALFDIALEPLACRSIEWTLSDYPNLATELRRMRAELAACR